MARGLDRVADRLPGQREDLAFVLQFLQSPDVLSLLHTHAQVSQFSGFEEGVVTNDSVAVAARVQASLNNAPPAFQVTPHPPKKDN